MYIITQDWKSKQDIHSNFFLFKYTFSRPISAKVNSISASSEFTFIPRCRNWIYFCRNREWKGIYLFDSIFLINDKEILIKRFNKASTPFSSYLEICNSRGFNWRVLYASFHSFRFSSSMTLWLFFMTLSIFVSSWESNA